MDVISTMKSYRNDLSVNITSFLNESVTVCDADLENANEKIHLLNFKSKLLSAKNNLPGFIKYIRNIDDSWVYKKSKACFLQSQSTQYQIFLSNLICLIMVNIIIS